MEDYWDTVIASVHVCIQISYTTLLFDSVHVNFITLLRCPGFNDGNDDNNIAFTIIIVCSIDYHNLPSHWDATLNALHSYVPSISSSLLHKFMTSESPLSDSGSTFFGGSLTLEWNWYCLASGSYE